MRLNHSSYFDTGNDVNRSNSLEEFTDSMQNHPRITRNTKKIRKAIENVHENLIKSKTEYSNTLDHDYASRSGEVPSKIDNDTKGYRRVLKGAGNKYEEDREQYLQESPSSERNSYFNKFGGVEEDNFSFSATFKSFASAVFFNSIFDDPPRGKTSNTNLLGTNGNKTSTNSLDSDKDWDVQHFNEIGFSESCFLMRFIKLRERASAAFEEAARTASFRYKTTDVVPEAICTFTNNDRSSICQRDEVNDNEKLVDYVDTISTVSLQHVNQSIDTDPLENVQQSPSECATDACWELNDGFCPHVEALLPDSGSTHSRGFSVWSGGGDSACSWLKVLVSQIEVTSSPSNHSSCYTSQEIPLEEGRGKENQESMQMVKCTSRDENGGIENSVSQISIKNDESDILFSGIPKDYPFTDLRNRGSPPTRTIIPGVRCQRNQSMGGLFESMDFFSPNLRTSHLSLNGVWQKESIMASIDDTKSNIETFDEEEESYSKVVGDDVRPKIRFLQDFESCNGNNFRGSKADSVCYEPLLSKFQSVKGRNFSDEDITFYPNKEVTMNLHHADKLSSIRVPDSRKISCELKDNRRDIHGSTTSTQIMNPSNQMDNNMINFDRDYYFEQLRSIRSALSSRDNSDERCNGVESIEIAFGRSSLQKLLSSSLLGTQHEFAASDQPNPCSRSKESSYDKHDHYGKQNCFPLSQYEQTELISGESRNSRTADLEYFVNIDDDIHLNKEVGQDLGSSSWKDALAPRIQSHRSNEIPPTNPDSLCLSSTDAGKSYHNDTSDSDQYCKISKNQYKNLGISSSRELVGLCSGYSHEIPGPCPVKYDFCTSKSFGENFKTIGKSSLDVSSRLEALNARIKKIFFNVDAALSKPRYSIDIQEGEGPRESKASEGRTNTDNCSLFYSVGADHFDGERASNLSNGTNSDNENVTGTWKLGKSSINSFFSNSEYFDSDGSFVDNKSEISREVSKIGSVHEDN